MEKRKIESIENRIYDTLSRDFLTAEKVIRACDILSRRIGEGMYHVFLDPLLKSGILTYQKIHQAVSMLSHKVLLEKVERELGKDRKDIYPLGVLLHVNPENAEGIAAYSVIEGLLGGNINLVKLPSNDYGITEFLLRELIRIEPILGEYIYLFSVRSSDERMKTIASLADGVIVWGGDEAIRGIRAMAKPNQKVIEWGHKISFAYITNAGMSDENLQALSEHIVQTKQMLCSSCQGIYLESVQKSEIVSFCRRMIDYLVKEVDKHPDYDMAWVANSSLVRYTYMLEHNGVHVLGRRGTSLLYCENRELEPGIGYGNIWVKTLKRELVIKALKKHHGYLQTVGLVCGEDERLELCDILIRAGVTQVRGVNDMSSVIPGDSHDGEYALRRYTKLVPV